MLDVPAGHYPQYSVHGCKTKPDGKGDEIFPQISNNVCDLASQVKDLVLFNRGTYGNIYKVCNLKSFISKVKFTKYILY